jgi:hypothetical protein
MWLVRSSISVLEGGVGKRVRSPLEAAYDHFRLDRQGDLVSEATLQHYDAMVGPFLTWAIEGAGVRRFEDLDVALVRAYRAEPPLDRERGTAGRCRRGLCSTPIEPC